MVYLSCVSMVVYELESLILVFSKLFKYSHKNIIFLLFFKLVKHRYKI